LLSGTPTMQPDKSAFVYIQKFDLADQPTIIIFIAKIIPNFFTTL